MTSILVVDDMAVFREPIAASLRLAGYETMCAADGEEALQLTRWHKPDLILLDVSMPKMDGITFLKHLRAEAEIANTRVILLTALSEKKDVLSAGSLGVRDYLLKSRFRLTDLLGRIKKLEIAAPAAGDSPVALSAQNAPQDAPRPTIVTDPVPPQDAVPGLLTRDQFVRRVEGGLESKALAGVLAQVIEMTNSPRGDTAQLAALIAKDSTLSARVLQTANSASYATPGRCITTIPDAILKIGCTTVRNIAASLGVMNCVPGADGINMVRCWQHSFAVAQLCEGFASANLADQSGLAYVIGLCHELGDIFVRTQFAKEYRQVVETAARTGRPVEQLHERMLGLTPAQAVSTVLGRMGLPDAIREPIEILHSPRAARATHPLARILWMAENYANAALLASGTSSEVAPFTPAYCLGAAGDQNPVRPNPQTLRAEVLSLSVMLAKLSRSEGNRVMDPLFAARPVKVWLARERGTSKFDPVGTALASLCDLRIDERLPADRDVQGVAALVVVSASSDRPGFSKRDIENALARARSTARPLPLLAIACDPPPSGQHVDGSPWRSSIALSELATFIEKLDKNQSSTSAA